MRSSTIKITSAGLLLTAIALFPADGLRALGLGEARVDSYLGQPLDVSIRLVEPTGDALDSLTVAAASPQDYDRLGIPSSALALGLEVTVDRGIDPPLIRVSSSREVSDPVVQVLVDARWASGRVLREYTLFLDPPTVPVAPPIRRRDESPAVSTEDEAPETVPAEPASQDGSAATPRSAPPRATEPRSEEPSPDPIDEPVESRPEQMEPASTAENPAPPRTARTVGPVAPGQTLWSIASAWRPSTGLTMNQVMLAILDQNPQAFIDRNVNQLRRNALLNMPSSDDIASIDPSEADRRMQAQMMAWQPRAVSEEVPVISDDAVPEVMDEREPAPVEEADDSSYRLEVVPPEGETVADVPAVSEAEVDEANQRLSELEDQFYDEGFDSNQLDQQIEDIREAIEARDMAGLAVANEELANLESRLRTAREERALADELAAQEETLVDAAADDPDEGPVDDVDDYFSDLGDELGVSEDDETAAAADEDSFTLDESIEEQTEAVEPAAEGTDAEETASDSLEDREADRPAPISVSGSSRDSDWSIGLLALIVGVLILLAGGALFVRNLLRNRKDNAPAVEPTLDVDMARARVNQHPNDLDAHLALLHALAMTDDEDQFADALDAMYAEVDDDNDSRWQDALNLAVLNAPDHPLLTPREVRNSADEDTMDGLDDRTREMLGILETPEDESNSGPADDYDIDSTLNVSDETDEADAFFDEAERESTNRSAEPEDESSQGIGNALDDEDEEFDLSALSDRLDAEEKPDTGTQPEPSTGSSGLEFDRNDLSDDESVLSDTDADHPVLESSDDDALDLDFEFSADDDRDDDTLTLDELGSSDDATTGDDDGASPADTLDLSGESASNDTMRMDLDELAELSAQAEDDSNDASDKAEDSGTVRADDTLDLVSNSDLDFEDLGDRELEAFLAEGDDVVDSDDDELMADDEAASILDSEDPEERAADQDDGQAELSDDDADVKLDLAQAYLSMDDSESAKTLLEEIVSGGSSAKRARAKDLLGKI